MILTEKFSNGIASCLDIEAIDALVTIITNLPDDPAGGRKGGFFSVFDYGSMGMVSRMFGSVPTEKMSQYFRNSTEKVTRIVKNGEAEYRSFQSRDETKEHWGGGVRSKSGVYAFSGFPEKLDEALSLVYALYVELEDKTEAEVVLSIKMSAREQKFPDNEFIHPIFLEFINWMCDNFETKLK